ncbi:hypothetical protein K4L44_03925 [Halosquirtibacter laminarini]|uniref:Uncharacterized protein n=1 Tax=Halosquirtibacter laminarini TaxID=3374600 RepID=A0AC61NKD5_9BACT|nr:hypothetical protein K4L44_03925 [Prolixibacteraceae bacterium]
MKKITIQTAKKIQRLILGESIPLGQLKNAIINQMIDDGVLNIKLQGRSKKTVFVLTPEAVTNYLHNEMGIHDLGVYIRNLESGTTRAENIIASSDSKSSVVRTFKGFLVNCVAPIEAEMHNKALVIAPQEGTYTYIHDYESFHIPSETVVVGIENPENFRYIQQQISLFDHKSILFVSRYPQSKDLIRWLQQGDNSYIHFGDFDFEGIRIFRDEYFKYLGDRASFFIPQNIEDLIQRYGNKTLYDKQFRSTSSLNLNEEVAQLIDLFHQYKRCLEQEIFISLSKE